MLCCSPTTCNAMRSVVLWEHDKCQARQGVERPCHREERKPWLRGRVIVEEPMSRGSSNWAIRSTRSLPECWAWCGAAGALERHPDFSSWGQSEKRLLEQTPRRRDRREVRLWLEKRLRNRIRRDAADQLVAWLKNLEGTRGMTTLIGPEVSEDSAVAIDEGGVARPNRRGITAKSFASIAHVVLFIRQGFTDRLRACAGRGSRSRGSSHKRD